VDQLKAVKSAHEAEWLAIEGVVAVGIGSGVDGSPCIVISVEHDSPRVQREVLARVPGVPVEIRVIGTPRANQR
jgi:hypothetical protein